MNRLFALMRYSKKIFWISIVCFVEITIVVSLVVFDLVQLILINFNKAFLSGLFIPLNIALISLLGANLILIACFVIIKRYKEKNNEFKEN